MAIFGTRTIPTCPNCSRPMKKKVQTSGQIQGLLKALIVIGVGVAVFILIPIIGWVLGPLIALYALGIGGKREKVWRCKACSIAVPRA